MNHIPVLTKDILSIFNPQSGDRLLDATLGLGGHTKAFLDMAGGSATAVGIEVDESALAQAKQQLSAYEGKLTFLQGNYFQIKDFKEGKIIPSESTSFSHILFDLGIGSHQLDDPERGFSFLHGSTLDMAFGENEDLPPSKLTSLNHLEKRLGRYPSALDIIQGLSKQQLAELVRVYGEEKQAMKVAVMLQEFAHLQNASEIANQMKEQMRGYERGRIHPATRAFQALRIAVNRELEVLEATLPIAIDLLAPNGKLGVISFHSLEDRIVKQVFRQEAKGCVCPPEAPVCVCDKEARVTLLTRKPVVASEQEIEQNPRSRSAKLRVVQKVDTSAGSP